MEPLGPRRRSQQGEVKTGALSCIWLGKGGEGRRLDVLPSILSEGHMCPRGADLKPEAGGQ